MVKPKVSIVILNYNGRRHTVKCLESLLKTSYKEKEIVLFNNGSTDDTHKEVTKQFPSVRVIEQKKNIGFCKGNNKALGYCHGRFILFLNNDTVVAKDFLEPLIDRLLSYRKNGIVQPKIVFLGSKNLQSGCAYFTNTGFLYYFGYDKNPNEKMYNKAREIYSANGACFLVKREVIEKVGFLDEDFFSYFEETDFCHRVLLAGYKIWYEPLGKIYHIGSVDNKQEKYSKLVYNSFRNRICSYLKNLEPLTLLKIMPLHVFLALCSSIVYLVIGRRGNSLAVLKALFYNAINLNNTLLKRREIQSKIRKIADSDFLPFLTAKPNLSYYPKLFNGLKGYKDQEDFLLKKEMI